jgi:3-methyladenine DNA glycosylase AlkD
MSTELLTSEPEARAIEERLCRLANAEKAAVLRRFFKTGPGEYGEGDLFLGINVPPLRQLAREYQELGLEAAAALLQSRWHEARLLALLVLVRRFARADEAGRRAIYDLYLAHTAFINNWDLVDLSAPHIVGAYLSDRSRRPLYRLARSRLLWERRMAVIATFRFIRAGDFEETLAIARILIEDREDLIHKAAGWMLREVGKRDRAALEAFLDAHGRRLPRVMLRYAIERLPPARRRAYLAGQS